MTDEQLIRDWFAGYTYAGISERHSIPRNTVVSRLASLRAHGVPLPKRGNVGRKPRDYSDLIALAERLAKEAEDE